MNADEALVHLEEERARRNGEVATPGWHAVDLGPILAGEEIDDSPKYLARSDGPCLLYPGKVHGIQAEPESGKGWFSLAACAERIEAGDNVAYLDFEDNARTAVARLRALSVSDYEIAERFHFFEPPEVPISDPRQLLALLALRPALVVIDGLTEAFTHQGLKIEDNSDIAKWLALVPRPLAAAGAAVLQIDHVTKNRENRGRFALGGQHKLAGIDVAYSLEVVESFGRGKDGRVRITVAKDRAGYVRALGGKTVAEMQVRTGVDGSVSIELTRPSGESEDGTWRPTIYMERVSRAVEAEPGIKKSALRDAVDGKSNYIDDAAALLVSEGYLHIEPGPRGAHFYHCDRPFRAKEAE